jgi:hypothetical protein
MLSGSQSRKRIGVYDLLTTIPSNKTLGKFSGLTEKFEKFGNFQ